jgi:hypothetical protein
MLGGSLLVGRYRCYVLNPADEVRAPSIRRFFVLKIQEEKYEAEVAMVDHDITCSIYNLLVSVEVESTQIEFRTESGVVAAPPGMQAIGFLSLDRQIWIARSRRDLHSSGADMSFAVWIYYPKRLV